jgi:hypothetical protein
LGTHHRAVAAPQRGAKAATIARRVSAISKAHQLAGVNPPPTREETVKATLAGIRRTIGTAQASKAGISIEELRRLVAACDPETKAALRDRALLVLAFAGAFRRSELVALDVADVEQVPDGLRILVRRFKTHQEAAGKRKPLPYGSNPATCPVRTLAVWLSAAEITEGPIFRPVDRHDQVQPDRLSDQSVALVVSAPASGRGSIPAAWPDTACAAASLPPPPAAGLRIGPSCGTPGIALQPPSTPISRRGRSSPTTQPATWAIRCGQPKPR